MSKITRDDVLKLARLSHISLSDEQVEKFTAELGEIMEYVEQLQAVDVSGLEPTDQVTGLTNVMRDDEVEKYQATPDELLKNAPAVSNHQIKVKRVIE